MGNILENKDIQKQCSFLKKERKLLSMRRHLPQRALKPIQTTQSKPKIKLQDIYIGQFSFQYIPKNLERAFLDFYGGSGKEIVDYILIREEEKISAVKGEYNKQGIHAILTKFPHIEQPYNHDSISHILASPAREELIVTKASLIYRAGIEYLPQETKQSLRLTLGNAEEKDLNPKDLEELLQMLSTLNIILIGNI